MKTDYPERSLYATLGIIIISTVTIITSIHSAYVYIETKNKIIQEMKYSSKHTIVTLQKNIANLIASYAINEYDKLTLSEMNHRANFAIIVEDYNMGKILGKKAYTSGKIKADNGNIIDYNPDNNEQNKQLEECYYSDRDDITSSQGIKLGSITIYISDHSMQIQLNEIIKTTIIKSVILSVFLILSLFITIRFFILQPLSNIIGIINNGDADGIPVKRIPNHGSTEIFDLANTINHMIRSIKDSRIKLTEQHNKLKVHEDQLHRSQKMDALGTLTGGIAHDFNNILGVVSGYAELLESRLKEQPKLARYAHEIVTSGERGAKLTRKLLSFSRNVESKESKLNLNTVLYEEKNMLEKTLTVRIKLVLKLAEDLWFVRLDKSDIEDAILNMSINAMHAIAANGQLTLQTHNESLSSLNAKQLGLEAKDYVVLSIIDTGCGMDKKIREKIFDPFFSTKGEKGTGLGLSQVYGFMERSKGTINVSSEPGQGTQLNLYFPRYEENNNKILSADGHQPTNLKGNEAILIVDDEPALLDLSREILSQQGYHVFCAEGAKQALEILAAQHINCLFSDVLMPDMDGYQLAAIVQKKYPYIKIQLTSGFSDDRHLNQQSDTLHQYMLYKPLSSHSLLQRIRTLLDEPEDIQGK
ncbi:MAG: response regulator [gamma proteobacterium symbiont of Taylorina sp.]|nr:response regulator [gamma proteobacterium symbiont of Taylorina sp.]